MSCGITVIGSRFSIRSNGGVLARAIAVGTVKVCLAAVAGETVTDADALLDEVTTNIRPSSALAPEGFISPFASFAAGPFPSVENSMYKSITAGVAALRRIKMYFLFACIGC